MERINVGDATLECVDELCYLGDMIGAGGGAEASSIMSQVCLKKFRKLLPLLTIKRLSLYMKGGLHAACVRSTYCKTLGIKEEDIHRFEHMEMRMVRWMSNATLRNRTSNEVLHTEKLR